MVCLASGPSLTPADCTDVMASGLITVAVNTTYQMAPWAEAVFAFDSAWWRVYAEEVAQQCTVARRYSVSDVLGRMGVQSLKGVEWFQSLPNSGACAINLAAGAGAKRVLLLGYDCQRAPDGRTHWHPDHPGKMSNARSLPRWPEHFARARRFAASKGCEVFNCSRATALTCFERRPLDQMLRDERARTEAAP